MDYNNEIRDKILLSLEGEISIKDFVCWIKQIYEQFFNSKCYECVKYRLINNILIDLKDLEDDIVNIDSLSNDEKNYVIELLNKEISYLNGERRYLENYKIKLNVDFENCSYKHVLEESIHFVLCQKELTANMIESLIKLTNSDLCVKVEDILINEIVGSILLINEANSSIDQMVPIGTLGKLVNPHRVLDENEYLKELYFALSGNRSIRFSLAISADRLLYTNIYVLNE